MHRSLVVVAAAFVVAGCASTPAPAPPPAPVPAAPPPAPAAAALVDRQGDSAETAVVVPADAPNDGIDFQNNWIYDRYGRFRRRGWGIAHQGEGSAKRMYEVVEIELADHSERKVYFDITDNWNHWKPTSK